MTDPFRNRAASMAGPGLDYAPVTPSDTMPLADVAIALYVEIGGTVTFVSRKGMTRSVSVPDYGYVVCGVTEVHETGTTASGIHAVVVT